MGDDVKSLLRWLTLFFVFFAAWPLSAAEVTIDDLMRLRTVCDVRISPDGKSVAYVISTPSFETAEHEAVLYVIPTTGDTPRRLTYGTRIFNRPLPAPAIRWSPDGSLITFVGFVDNVPQVMAISPTGGEAYSLTSVKEGVTNYKWAPGGKQIAFRAPDAVPAEETQRKKDKTYVIEVDRNQRVPRLWVQDVPKGTPKVISPTGQTVVDFSWAPDGRTITYSASSKPGFFARYNSTVYTVPATGGEPRTIVNQPGTNRAAHFSPDGRWIAFVSSGGSAGMITAKDLYVVSVDASPDSIRKLTTDAWMGEFTWVPDSRSILYTTWEPGHGSGEHMFELPIMRVELESGRSEPLTPGPVVNYFMSISDDGTRVAYKSVESRTVGDVYVTHLADGKTTRLTDINPELRQLELGEQKPVSWKSFDGAEIWGLLLTPPGYEPGKRIPLVVYCHGGPIGGFNYGIFPHFPHIPGQVSGYPSEAMAGVGIAVLFPMPRGGSGYGVGPATAPSLNPGERLITRTSWPGWMPWWSGVSPTRTGWE